MFELVWCGWCITVSEVKGEGVPVTTNSIALVSIAFSFVRYPQSQSIPSLKTYCLLINSYTLSRHPTALGILP
jgi:hypothetical protein